MSLTLLVENNPNLDGIYKLNLSTWLGLDVLSLPNHESAIDTLSKNVINVDLIITRASIQKSETAKLIVGHLQNLNSKIPVIVIGPGEEVEGSFAHVPNSLQIKVLIQSAAKALGITAKAMSEQQVNEYYPIPLAYFSVLKRSSCDIYIQNEETKEFEVWVPQYEDIDEKKFKILLRNNLAYLYVHKLARLEFVNNLTLEFIGKLKRSDLSTDENISASDKGIELLTKKISDLGVSEETIKLANKNIDNIKQNIKSNPKLSGLLDRLLKNKSSYLFKHTQILTYVGLHIVKNIDWGSEDQEEKICFIAFFHDIVLENDEQAKIKSDYELKRSNLPQDQKKLVEKHAQLSSEFVAKFPHAPMGADQIICQHHGTLNGLGFAEHYGNNVSPVAVVFIVAEEFTRILLKHEDEPLNKETLMRELKEEFPTSRFQKVIETLESLTI